jgi:hypothetical protein
MLLFTWTSAIIASGQVEWKPGIFNDFMAPEGAVEGVDYVNFLEKPAALSFRSIA